MKRYTADQLNNFIDYIFRKHEMTETTRQKRMDMIRSHFKNNNNLIAAICEVLKVKKEDINRFCDNPDNFLYDIEKREEAKITFNKLSLNDEDLLKKLPDFIRTRRMEMLLSQAELAAKVKTNPKFIKQIESGEKKKIDPAFRRRLFTPLKATLQQLQRFNPLRDTIRIDPIGFSKLMSAYKSQNKLSMEGLAFQLGLNDSYCQKLMNAEIEEITLTELKAFCKMSGYTPRTVSDLCAKMKSQP